MPATLSNVMSAGYVPKLSFPIVPVEFKERIEAVPARNFTKDPFRRVTLLIEDLGTDQCPEWRFKTSNCCAARVFQFLSF